MTIVSAKYVSPTNSAVQVLTDANKRVVVQLSGADNSSGVRAQYLAWAAAGGTTSPYVAPVKPSPTAYQFLDSQGYTTENLLALKHLHDQLSAGAAPKLDAVFAWINGIIGSYIAGQSNFANAPYTFQETALQAYQALPKTS